MRPFRRSLATAVALTGLLTIVGMAPPLLMRRLLNDVAKEGRWDIFPVVIGLLFLVPVLRACVNIANSLTLNSVGLGIISRTRRRLFRRLMSLSLRFYNEMSVGGINQRLMGDVATVSGVATGGLITLVTDTIAVAFALIAMLGLSRQLSLLTFALLPLYYLNYRFFSRRMVEANARLRANMDHISSMLQERLSAHELIQAYGQEEAEATQFSSQAKQVMDSAIRGSAYNISFNQLSAFINKIGNTFIYCAGCYFFVKETMGYGDVVAFCAYATQILGPVVRFAAVANQIVQAGVSVDRIQEILDREPAITESPDPRPIESVRGDVELEGVGFAYGDGSRALDGLDLKIPGGSHVAIVGRPGAGRSTLAMLIRRFFDPHEGRIRVDGIDVREYRLGDYRRTLGLVPAECTVFDGTIRENLCYGSPEAPEDRMIAIAKEVGLHDFIMSLREGYETRVGAGGLKLATGHRQRIGVARALLAEPSLLIVDEATAALDPESAEDLSAVIRSAMRERTCLIIVHRVLLARDADRIAVMDHGRVVDAGSHEELIRRPASLYRDLFAMQYGEHRLPPVRKP